MTSWKKTFYAAFFAQVLSIAGFTMALPFTPFFLQELGVRGDANVARWSGYVAAGPTVTMAIFAPIWGILADRYSRRLMVMRAMFGGAVVMLLMAYVRTPGELLACRMLQGCLAGTMTACTALVAGVAPRERSGYALGMMQMAVYLGAALGPFFGGLVADHLGYRVAFHIAALQLWAGGVLVKYATEEKQPEGEAPARAKPGTFRHVFAATGFLSAVFVLVMLRFANSVARPIFPLLVKEIHGTLEGVNTLTGSIFTVGAIAAAVTALLFGRLADRWGAKRLLIAFSLFGSAVAVAHVFAHTVGQLFLLRVLLGLTAAGMIPAANAIIRKTTDDHNLGKAYGVTASLRSVGWALGMLAGSTLAAHMGLRAPFILMGAALVLTTFVVIACIRPEEKPLEAANAP